MENYDIQVGDRVTYINPNDKYDKNGKEIEPEIQTDIVTEIRTRNFLNISNENKHIKILKIERPTYTVVEEKKCEFCEKSEKFSTSYIDVTFQKVLPRKNNQVLIQFKGCPPYSKCSSKDVVQNINNVFEINYCPMCR